MGTLLAVADVDRVCLTSVPCSRLMFPCQSASGVASSRLWAYTAASRHVSSPYRAILAYLMETTSTLVKAFLAFLYHFAASSLVTPSVPLPLVMNGGVRRLSPRRPTSDTRTRCTAPCLPYPPGRATGENRMSYFAQACWPISL